jgi:excisionase family DNA binding protein
VTPLMGVKEVAAVLGVHPNTVYALASAGRLPHYRVGGRGKGKGVLRFDEAGVRQYLDAQRRQTNDGQAAQTNQQPQAGVKLRWLRTK